MSLLTKVYLLLFLCLVTSVTAKAQMERERTVEPGALKETFWAPNLVGMATTHQLSRQSLNVTIMHIFGIATDRPLQNFGGLDFAPNVRLGLDYGITNYWSVGIGRTTFGKIVDLRSKLTLTRQLPDRHIPVSIALKGDLAVSTSENRQPFTDDINWLLALPTARRINSSISVQIVPMYAHFNSTVQTDGSVANIFALGLGTEIHFSDRYGLVAEYYPVLGDRPQSTKNAFSLGLNIETGGHVFQLFFASAQWPTEQYILAQNRDQFWAGDLRFGFNVNRLFGLGKR